MRSHFGMLVTFGCQHIVARLDEARRLSGSASDIHRANSDHRNIDFKV